MILKPLRYIMDVHTEKIAYAFRDEYRKNSVPPPSNIIIYDDGDIEHLWIFNHEGLDSEYRGCLAIQLWIKPITHRDEFWGYSTKLYFRFPVQTSEPLSCVDFSFNNPQDWDFVRVLIELWQQA